MEQLRLMVWYTGILTNSVNFLNIIFKCRVEILDIFFFIFNIKDIVILEYFLNFVLYYIMRKYKGYWDDIDNCQKAVDECKTLKN